MYNMWCVARSCSYVIVWSQSLEGYGVAYEYIIYCWRYSTEMELC